MLQKQVSAAAYANIQRWLSEPKYAEYRDELQEMIDEQRWQDLEDAFFKVIEFGTGGMRGTTGVGSNRINRVTVGESTQALCEYAASFDEKAPKKGIAIACDTRLSSPELSRYAAQVVAANGFKAYIFDGFRSTPELSFALRELGCAAGIVITASHNPPSDNGFKAYWSDGAQLVPPHDIGVLEMAAKVDEVRSLAFDEAVKQGSIEILGKEIDEKYIAAVVNEAEGTERDLKIVYSPLHGAGQRNTLPVLQAAGFSVDTVDSQMTPDGNFPTIENGKANPEARAANDHAVAELMLDKADIAITNDPDADRFGIIVRQGDEPIYLSGNQSAVLGVDYTLRKRQEKGLLTGKQFVAKTIVTTDMIEAIASRYGVKCYGNMLVGFKYVGEIIRQKEGKEEFLFGSEESFGSLKGTYARDKDGASASLPLAEYAAELKREGRTLYDRLLELYTEYGLFVERLDTFTYPGAKGFAEMREIMERLRKNPPAEVGGHKTTAVLDYSTLTRTDVESGATSEIDCIKGNVVVLEFDNEPARRFTIRPSGTEPILKVYTQWKTTELSDDIEEDYRETERKLEGLARELEGAVTAD